MPAPASPGCSGKRLQGRASSSSPTCDSMRTSAPLAAVFALASAIAAAGERAALPAVDRVYVNPAPAPVADFTLTDQYGKPRGFSSLKGEPALLFFGFTHCPNVCPTALGRLKLLHQARDGDPKATSRIAARFAAVFFMEPAGQDGNYNVMHSTRVFAVDEAGRLRASIAGASIEDMATITALLLAEP